MGSSSAPRDARARRNDEPRGAPAGRRAAEHASLVSDADASHDRPSLRDGEISARIDAEGDRPARRSAPRAAARCANTRSRPAPARTAADAPLIGRKQELGLLMDRWELMIEGRGQVVTVSGEPGIGKSRVALALQTSASRRHRTRWLECRRLVAHAGHAASPDREPAGGRLRPRRLRNPGAEGRRESRTELLRVRMDPAASCRSSRSFTRCRCRAEYAPMSTRAPTSQRRRRWSRCSSGSCARATPSRWPCSFEDLHWVDPTTVELLTTTRRARAASNASFWS